MKKISLILFLFFLMSNVNSQSLIGVSPGDIRFEDVLRGGYAQRPMLVSLNSEEGVKMEVETWGDIKDWINFSEREYIVSKDEPWRLLVKISPPSDVPNGNYSGFVRVKSDSLSNAGKEGHAVGAIQAVIDVGVTVLVSDREIKSCRASNFRVNSVEKGDDIEFKSDVLNQGNIRLRPFFSVKIWDQEQINLVKEFEYQGGEILPTTTAEMNFRTQTDDLEIGQYWVDVIASDCFDSETLTFDVLEEGALRADGVITGIVTKTWSSVGETIPIEIGFKNTGEKEIDSQFVGKISLGESVVLPLSSRIETVSVGDSTNFTFYYTPKESGRYVVSGRVFYDKKRTFESSSIINVRPKNITLNTILWYSLYALVFFGVIYLFYRVRKEKNVYLSKLRRIKGI